MNYNVIQKILLNTKQHFIFVGRGCGGREGKRKRIRNQDNRNKQRNLGNKINSQRDLETNGLIGLD